MLSFFSPSDAVLVVDMITGLEMEQSCLMLPFLRIFVNHEKKNHKPLQIWELENGVINTNSLVRMHGSAPLDYLSQN